MILVVHTVPHEIFIFSISSQIIFIFASVFFIISTFSGSKGLRLLIIVTACYLAIIFLALFINKNLIYMSFIFVLFEFIVIKLKIARIKESLSKADILLAPMQVVFVAASFSMYHQLVLMWAYIALVLAVSLFSMCIFRIKVNLLKKDIPRYVSMHIVKKVVITILVFIYVIPILYSYQLSIDGLHIKIDFLIYGLTLLVYPYAKMLIFQQKYKNKSCNNIE